MLALLNDAIMWLADPLLGWLLWLPSDLALVVVALATGAILCFVRLITTNQDLLRRCAQDKRRLKQLLRHARRRKDKAALKRLRKTRSMVTMLALRAEAWPLLVALVPIALLGTWCFQRLAFVPPQAGETIEVAAYFLPAAGRLAHLVPQPGLEAENGWVQQIAAVADPAEGPPYGLATWRLRAEPRPVPYQLQIRCQAHTWTKQLLVGQPRYAPPVEFYIDQPPLVCCELKMRPVKLFGLVPGIAALALPPWLVGYLVLAVPAALVLRRLTGTY